jgi:phenol 2-monooxygenase
MMDTFNLAWKIAHVVQGSAKSSILSTYEQERHQVAQELIEYDFQLSRLFSGDGGSLAVDANTDVFREFIAKGAAFTTGCTVDYAASVLVSKPSVKYASPLASKLNIGMCIPDARFVMQCDSRPWFIQDRLPSNGTWRIINFAGDFKTTPTLGTQLAEVGRYFGSEESFIKKYTPQGARFDSAFELLLVHACNTHNVEWDDFALAFRQRDTIQLSFGFETQVLTIQEPVDES